MSAQTKRFGLFTRTDDALATAPKGGLFKAIVTIVKDGPTAGVHCTELIDAGDTDVPMPRKKTEYELFLKHKVRQVQVSETPGLEVLPFERCVLTEANRSNVIIKCWRKSLIQGDLAVHPVIQVSTVMFPKVHRKGCGLYARRNPVTKANYR